MAYVALYRKYRSQTFNDVAGQEHVLRAIRNSIERGKIGQAYLFTGSRGTGKTTVARLLAKAVNCVNGPTPDPCNVCAFCTAVTNGSAVDVTEVDAASNRGVAEMEAICDSVRYQPMESRYRVVILDEAHQLSDHAKDAFLKTLEEPPSHAIFVLATTEPSKIPITIRSRCQQFDFRRGTPAQIEERLAWVCQQESIKITPEAVTLVARHAQGSWRDGLSLLEQVIAFSGEEISEEDARQVLGALPQALAAGMLEAIISRQPDSVIVAVQDAWRSGVEPVRLLSGLIEYCKDQLQAKVAGKSTLSISQTALVHLIYHLAEAESSLRNWERTDLAVEVAMISACEAASQAVVASANVVETTATERPASKPPQQPRQKPGPPPDQPAPQPPASQQAPSAPESFSTEQEVSAPVIGNADLETVQRSWPRVIEQLRHTRANTSLCAILKDGWPVCFEDGVVTISYPSGYSFHVQRADQESNRKVVEQGLLKTAGISARIRNTLEGESPAKAASQPEKAESAPSNKTAVEPDKKQPGDVNNLCNEVLQIFGGEILDDKDPFS